MLHLLLPTLALLALLASLLTWRPAPPFAELWKLAIAAGEFGQWLALFPLGLAALAWFATDGWTRGATLALCALAVGFFLRPTVLAWRLGAHLPGRLQAAFGERRAANQEGRGLIGVGSGSSLPASRS